MNNSDFTVGYWAAISDEYHSQVEHSKRDKHPTLHSLPWLLIWELDIAASINFAMRVRPMGRLAKCVLFARIARDPLHCNDPLLHDRFSVSTPIY